MTKIFSHARGFALPTVLAISLAVLVMITSLLSVTSNAFRGSFQDHYQMLAEEAAEAGAAYATGCLAISNHAQTWGPALSKPSLSPSTDCAGAANYPGNAYVYSGSTVRTYFTVNDLEFSLQFSAQVSSSGYAEVLRGDGSVARTYQSVVKKVITWPSNFVGQMSASGTNRTCAIVTGSVYCWGYGAYGQLGNGSYLGGNGSDIESAHAGYDSTTPVKVKQDTGLLAGKTVSKIFVAQYHSCALTSDGLVYCWGRNSVGQLGDGTLVDRPVPIQVGGLLAGKVVTDIGGSGNTSCAIASSQLYCWGQNDHGQVGNNSTATQPSPVLISVSGTPTALSTSGSRSNLMCAIISDHAYCWGQNNVGSVGDGTSGTDRKVPTKVVDTGVLSGKTVTAISQDGYVSVASGGYPHVCALASGAIYCWGDNGYGQLGDGTTTSRSAPVATIASGVLNGRTIQDIKVGLRHSCALADGGVYCWGLNSSGQIGDNTNTTRSSPVTVYQEAGRLSSSNVLSIGAGANRSCAVINDGRSFCWGLNSSGQIGDGTTTDRKTPTESLFLRPSANIYIY